jgi:hypothetical protein
LMHIHMFYGRAIVSQPQYMPLNDTSVLCSAAHRDELVTFTLLKECMDVAPYTSDAVDMQDQNTHMSGKVPTRVATHSHSLWGGMTAWIHTPQRIDCSCTASALQCCQPIEHERQHQQAKKRLHLPHSAPRCTARAL